ncbi:Sec-independent protein translocase protein TatB [Citreimonas salinaria]|uniref:Sec-independent protein translocase protein TatB n=1 Tax=Citreimonas salinaria TaxID=321339 RepID=A0A1H3G9S8_9RHOB|nr:Sec-independent protein translocase protein TatB [Citreimonas salinaria]SDX99815.1 sec-independent protein translocase protein TatB [Citreimonas salinaria]
MLDLGWSEMLVIGVVALIVVGPKDLPHLFRNVGRFMGKARGMAREFSRAMNDAADESGVRDVAKTFKSATNPVGSAMDGVKDAARDLSSFDPESKSGKKKEPLSAEREAAKRKIEASSARAAAERKKREADEAMRKAEELETASRGGSDAAAEAAPKKDET